MSKWIRLSAAAYLRLSLLSCALLLSLALPAFAADGLRDARKAQHDGRYTEAIVQLDRRLLALPDDTIALRLRAECYQYLGNLARAEADLRAGLAIAPESPELLEGLGWLQLFQKKFAAAEASLLQARRFDPDSFWIRLNLGHARLLLGRDDEAMLLYCELMRSETPELLGPSMRKDFARLRAQGIVHTRYTEIVDKFVSRCGPGLVPPGDCAKAE